MPKYVPKTGKEARAKTAVQGKRFLCAKCRKRSPRPVKTPAPWHCPAGLKENAGGPENRSCEIDQTSQMRNAWRRAASLSGQVGMNSSDTSPA